MPEARRGYADGPQRAWTPVVRTEMRPVRWAYKSYFFSQQIIFFFHNKSANNTFSHGVKRTGQWPTCGCHQAARPISTFLSAKKSYGLEYSSGEAPARSGMWHLGLAEISLESPAKIMWLGHPNMRSTAMRRRPASEELGGR